MQFPTTIGLDDFFEAYDTRDERLRPVVEHILRREGFGACDLMLLSGSNLTYAVDDRYVFKAFPTDAAFEGIIERDMLRACTADGLVATPELVTSGEDGWQWVMMTKLPGRELRLVRGELSTADRLRVTRQLAEWAAAFRDSGAVQSTEIERPEHWPSLQSKLRRGLAKKLGDRGLGDAWLAQLDDFYSDWEPIDDARVVHADLHDMNILVDQTARGWELSAVFDFADTMRAPLIYEVAAPLLFVARGVRTEVESLCTRLLGEVPSSRVLLQWALLHRFAHLQHYLDHFDYIPAEAATLEDVARAVAGTWSP